MLAFTGMRNEHAPPPWLSRMAVLGVPPRYQDLQAAASAGRDDTTAAGDLLHFVEGSDDDNTDEVDSDEEDAHAVGSKEQLQLDSQGAPPAADQPEHEGQCKPAANGGRADDRKVGVVLFPGINCPIPEGADQQAWEVELDKGLFLSRSLMKG